MTPRKLLSDLRSRGLELQVSPDLKRVLYRGASEEDRDIIRRERLWLLMLLAHEVGADLYDPRLAFVDQADDGLTRGGIATRMWLAFGITRELADALTDLAIEAGYLRAETIHLHHDHRDHVYRPVGAVAAVLAQREALPA